MLDDLLGGESEEPEEGEDGGKDEIPVATLDLLKKKQKVVKTVRVAVNDDAGNPIKVQMTFQGIPAQKYDKMLSRYPPRPKDKKQGYTYNPDEFGPALIAATCIEPEMTMEDAKEIWESENWNRGERLNLLMTAIEVCTAGLNVPFKRSASG